MTGPRHAAPKDTTRQLPAALEGGRAAYGLLQLARPGRMATILGARLLVQAAVTWLVAERVDRRSRCLLHGAGGAVDALHAASMVGLAAVSSRHRGRALRQARAATVLTVAELASATACSAARPGGARPRRRRSTAAPTP